MAKSILRKPDVHHMSTVQLLGQRVSGLAPATAVLAFIASFGIVKALANLFARRLSDRICGHRCAVIFLSQG